jgi:hypothetical protein
MAYTRRDGTGSAILALSLALGGEWTVRAQDISTGSGVGTGPSDLGGTALPLGPRQGTVPFGPGVDVSFPTDPFLLPFLLPEEAANPVGGQASSRITTDLLRSARQITDPAERSLALRQIANGAITTNQMMLAHHTLEEAIAATSDVNVPLVRDQRLIGLVTSLNALSDALLRVGHENQNVTATPEEAQAAGLEPLPKLPESTVLIRMARLEWRRAVYLASIIGNPTYRNEMLYRVAEDEAVGSSYIVNEYTRGLDIESLGNRPVPVPVPRSPARPVAPDPLAPPAAIPPRPAPGGPAAPGQATATPENRPGAPPAPAAAPAPAARGEAGPDYAKLADEVLVDAWDVARQIDRLLWKNRAMVRIALSASDSGQFSRAVELSRTIENAESRSEALLLLAEAMCRPSNNQLEAATSAYQAAAEAVASIPQDGLRGVMTGFLIDSLIASGRFDDARACTVIYPEESERFVALGAIAESQGKRGLAESARRWIANEAPEAYRSALYRRVTAGVLWAIENQRSKELPIGSELPPAR